jgi:hypothetical protein
MRCQHEQELGSDVGSCRTRHRRLLVDNSPARADRGDDRDRHPGHNDQHGHGWRHHPTTQSAHEVPAEGRQVRKRQVRIRVEQLHLGPARHQRHGGEQASVRHDGRLSAGGERLHLPEQPGKQEPAHRGCGLQPLRIGQRSRRPQGLAVLRALRSQGEAGQRAVRLRRAWHGAQGDAGPRLARRLLPAGEPEPRSRVDQPSGKEDRRPRRLRAVR